ncbi:MAG: response regulator transcription factor [Bacteroidota bacterium]
MKILIADDHPIFRQGLKQILGLSDTITYVEVASDGSEALKKAREDRYDVIVLDVEMPGLNGLDTAGKLIEFDPESRIIFLTMYKEEDMFNRALDLGIKGFVLKENAADDILEAIIQVASGKYYITSSISDFLVRRTSRAVGLKNEKPGLDKLTPSERNILRMISRNLTSKQIAEELFVSYKTVENHRVNIARKLELHGTHALLKFALENKSLL